MSNQVPEELVNRYIEYNERRLTFRALYNFAENEYNALVGKIKEQYGDQLNLIIEAKETKDDESHKPIKVEK